MAGASNTERRIAALERQASGSEPGSCVLFYPLTEADQRQADRLRAAGRVVFLLPRNGRD